MRLLQEQDAFKKYRLQELRREIQCGIEQADRGELIDGEAVMDELRLRHEKAMEQYGKYISAS